LLGRRPPGGRHGGHADDQVGLAASRSFAPIIGANLRLVGKRHSVSARPTASATQTGLSPPSRSRVNLVTTWYQPPPSSSTEAISAVARTFEPAGTGAGKRTLF